MGTRRLELTITSDYVKNWGVADAVRELFQNAIDQEKAGSDNKMTFSYDGLHDLTISNKSSVLTTDTLLLGSTSKEDAPDLIGQFGEGYKIATLVLLRMGKTVTFYNYGAREVWKPKMVKSRRFNGASILTFFVSSHVWTKVPDDNLTIVVESISPTEYDEIRQQNLHLQEGYDKFGCEYGEILTDEDHRGKIFVGGLYVCTEEKFCYGYNFLPKYLQLNRDRKFMGAYSLRYLTSKAILSTSNTDVITKSLEFVDAESIPLVADYSWDNVIPISTANIAYSAFTTQYGVNAIPVKSQEEYDNVTKTYHNARPVVVSAAKSCIIKAADTYMIRAKPIEVVKQFKIKGALEAWYEKYDCFLTSEARDALNVIIDAVPEDADLDIGVPEVPSEEVEECDDSAEN